MQIEDLEYFRDRLLERRTDLSDWLASERALGFTDVNKARQVLKQIRDALDRIDDESYGECVVCHGEIEHERLSAQPEIEVCLDCLSENEKRAIEDDMKTAGRLQRALLPPTVPRLEGFTVAARLLGAGSVGGDYYDFLKYGDNEEFSRIIIADAMGHGITAGLLMSNLQGVLRLLSQDIHSAAKLVTRLNQWLCRNLPIAKFVSLACLCIEKTDVPETKITYVNAGHCPPILMRSDGTVEQLDGTGGILGVHEQFKYEERQTSLRSGDFLLLYTDGVVESENSSGRAFGTDGLINFITGHKKRDSEKFVDDLIDEIARFSNSATREDDLTVISLFKN